MQRPGRKEIGILGERKEGQRGYKKSARERVVDEVKEETGATSRRAL